MKRALLEDLLAARAAKHATALVTDLSDGRQVLVVNDQDQGELALSPAERELVAMALNDDRSGMLPESQLFVRVFNPPLRLLVVGAVHITQALAPMAQLAGYEVTVIDPRGAWATDDRFPGIKLDHDWPDDAMARLAPDRRTAVVTLTHDPKLDDPALSAALDSSAFYIGSLGSKRTHGARLKRLERAGYGEAQLTRILGPIGLDIGAKSPAEIAVAILAQITAVRRGRAQPAKTGAAKTGAAA